MNFLAGAGGSTAASGAASAGAAGAGAGAASGAAGAAGSAIASTAVSSAASSAAKPLGYASGAVAPKGLDLSGLLRDAFKENFSKENLSSMIKDELKPRSTFDPFSQKKSNWMSEFQRLMNE